MQLPLTVEQFTAPGKFAIDKFFESVDGILKTPKIISEKPIEYPISNNENSRIKYKPREFK